MTTAQAQAYRTGALASGREIRVNKASRKIEIMECSHPAEDSRVGQMFLLLHSGEAGFREANAATLTTVHEITNGGEGREVDDGILRAWKALGLPDNSVKVDMEGRS